MAEILSFALKENKCEGLQRLIVGLMDGANAQIRASIMPGRHVRGVITLRSSSASGILPQSSPALMTRPEKAPRSNVEGHPAIFARPLFLFAALFTPAFFALAFGFVVAGGSNGRHELLEESPPAEMNPKSDA
jgi:hypothetical protein